MPSERSATVLFRAHRTMLVDYADSIVRDRSRAEDVVQEAWERFDTADRRRTPAEPLRYLYRIVRNLALDGQRAIARERRRFGPQLAEISDVVADMSPSQEAEAAAKDELRIVLAAMNELPERSRLALQLHSVEGLKLREVAERLGVSVTYTHQLVADAKLHCLRRLSRGR